MVSGWRFSLFILGVGILNILLNLRMRIAGTKDCSYLQTLRLPEFHAAAGIGVLSLFCLLAVYRNGANLAQGILLMGATSIIGGTLVGMARGDRLQPIEMAIFVTIAILYAVRLVPLLLKA